MPWGDGTGPFGGGPRTGRGLGYCAGYDRPGYAWGGGGYVGRGGGRGFRNRYYATGLTGWQRAQAGVAPVYGPPVGGWAWAAPTKEQQAANLKAQAESMERALSELRRQLSDLEGEESK
jgi:hypothetical protein